jgi:glycosyltransferase involved in cell wall biosynthesis
MPIRPPKHRARGGGGALFVGRLTAQKRVELAIEAVAILARDRPAIRLTIVGEGPARVDLEARARELGQADRVRFLGSVAPDDLPAALSSADLFLFPARAEGLGLAAVEALAAGVPVVACRDGGGVTDVMAEPGAGLQVEPTASAIADAGDRLLADPAARDAAWRAGNAWVERLAPERVAEQCEEWYREALGG